MKANTDDERGGDVAIVTGGGSGIGREIALELVRGGWRCLIAGLDKLELEETRTLACDPEKILQGVQCDLSTRDGRDALIASGENISDQLGLLVNCAALSGAMPLFKQDEEFWKRQIETNIIAVAILSAWAIDSMKKSGGGSIVNIGSVYGRLGVNGKLYDRVYPQNGDHGPMRWLSYAASKGAIAALSRELAASSGRWNIRVNTVSPGMIDVPARKMTEEQRVVFRQWTPLGRVGKAGDVAAVVAFLASDAASFVTGADWVVDGGWSAW